MKRSRINQLIRDAELFFDDMKFALPPWTHWTPDQWAQHRETACEIFENGIGWDITDFGSGSFDACGLLLITLRNGRVGADDKTYAEKIMIVQENQVTPMHFHWQKMEDIINRGGGNLVLELAHSDEQEDFMDTDVTVSVDGIERTLPARGRVVLEPGESICLTPGLYHTFRGEPGKGPVLVGEVSRVNDDHTDNRFNPSVGRFPAIDEDEEPYRLLSNDYGRILN